MGSLLTSGVALHYLYCVQSESALLRLNFWLGFALQEGVCVCVSVFETACVNVSAPINSCVFCLFFSAQIFSSVLTEKAFKSQRKRLSFWTNCCPHSTFSRWASCLFFFFENLDSTYLLQHTHSVSNNTHLTRNHLPAQRFSSTSS